MTEKFTQKYSLVCFLEPVLPDFKFDLDSWPLHTTILDVFAVDATSQEILAELKDSISETSAITVTVQEKRYFGEKKDIPVMILEKTGQLQALHESVAMALDNIGLHMNSPQFAHEGFIPHITVKNNQAVSVGDKYTFDNITLVDMFPGGDGYGRRILGTITLG